MKSEVFDRVRKKKVALTPEEGVRQWLIDELSQNYGYPLNLMCCEYAIDLNGVKYRGDLVVLDKKLNPVLIAECKAPGVKISKNSFKQILRYNLSLKVNYILVTNGLETYMAGINNDTGDYNFLPAIPRYEELSQQKDF